MWVNTCRVKAAGPVENGDTYIMLNDRTETETPAFPGDRWFSAYPGREREMLATALAAIASGHYVRVDLEDVYEYAKINRIYMMDGLI